MRTSQGLVAGASFAVSAAFAPVASAGGRPVAHFYLVNEPSSLESLERHAAQVGLVSPQWFAVDGEGRLESTVDPALVRWAAEQRLPLMPLLVNRDFDPRVAHALLASSDARSRLTSALLDAAVAARFHGLQLDFENVAEEDRDRYADFVKALAGRLRKRGLRLSVALPAPLAAAPLPSSPRGATPWVWPRNENSLGFDYGKIAKAVDFVSLMAYDQHAAPGEPGPVAGLPWVEACLRRTLEWVPAKKLRLGIPLYHRQWSGKAVTEGSYEEARAMAERRGAAILMDPTEREKTLAFGDGAEAAVAWLQDRETLRERLELVRRYGLGGLSAWRLGHEDPALWDEPMLAPPARRR